MPGQMGYNPIGMGMGAGNSSPPGSFPHMSTAQSFNMANMVPPSQPPTNMQNRSSANANANVTTSFSVGGAVGVVSKYQV